MKRTEQDPDTLKEPLKVNYGSPYMKINNIKICLLILFLLYLFFCCTVLEKRYDKQVRLGKNLQTRLILVTVHIRVKSGFELFTANSW